MSIDAEGIKAVLAAPTLLSAPTKGGKASVELAVVEDFGCSSHVDFDECDVASSATNMMVDVGRA